MHGDLFQNVRFLGSLAASRLLGRPLLLSHLVTTRCALRCQTCIWRGLTDWRDDLTPEEIAPIYRDAFRCGIRVNSVWGGEPLVREDLPEILQASRDAGLLTVLISSGYRFAERFDEIVGRTDVLIFSLDHLGRRHDDMRGAAGLFQAVCNAITRLRADAPHKRVYINTAVSRLNLDAVPELAHLARDLGAAVYFNPIETGMLGRAESSTAKLPLALDDARLSDLARSLIVLKGRGFPIANSYTFLRGFLGGKRPYRCHARKLCLELRPNGDLMDCLNRFTPVANLRDTALTEVLGRPEIRRLRLQKVRCHFCNNANVIDTSHLWELRPESIYSLVRRNLPST